VNEFIADVMDYYYLWSDDIIHLPPNDATDPKAYFKSLLHGNDHWSYITDDREKFLEEEINQTGETFGYELAFSRYSNSTDIYAIVLYVYPGSPAATAGLERGNVIVKVNDKPITLDNYTELRRHGTIKVSLAKLEDDKIVPTGISKSITSAKMDQDPLLVDTIIRKGAHTIGYMMYTGFVNHYRESLTRALARFKSEGITDLVLDLRYNPGGELSVTTLLCSAIVPRVHADGKDLLITHQWNDNLQAELEEAAARDPGTYTGYLETRFEPVDCNLELPHERVYVLTSRFSASASELLVSGLIPYMEVIQLGDTTTGKYTAMIDVSPADPSLANWLLLPVVYKYLNSEGFTDFANGLIPQHVISESLASFRPLGDENEPYLAKAIELITNDPGPEVLESAPAALPARWLHLPSGKFLDGKLLHRLPLP
jgi:C-terminal processing protease CtpA/Prc